MDRCGHIQKFQANLSNNPKVGSSLAAAAKIREVGSCPDDGRASHEEGDQPASGKLFTSHERVLDPAQEG